jgi:hypothetical protein
MFKAKKGGVYFIWIALPKTHKGMVNDTPHAAYVAVTTGGVVPQGGVRKQKRIFLNISSIISFFVKDVVAAEGVSAHVLYLEVTVPL